MGKEYACNLGDGGNAGSIPGFYPSSRGHDSLLSVLLPGESHGQRSLEGYSPRGSTQPDTTEHACTHTLITETKAAFRSLPCPRLSNWLLQPFLALFAQILVSHHAAESCSVCCLQSLPGRAVPEVLEKEMLTSTVRIPVAALFIIVFNTNDSSPKHLFSLHTEMCNNNVHRASV